MKMIGLALSRNIVDFANMLFCYIVIKYDKRFDKTFIPFNKKAFNGWMEYLYISVPLGSIQYFEWSFNEL